MLKTLPVRPKLNPGVSSGHSPKGGAKPKFKASVWKTAHRALQLSLAFLSYILRVSFDTIKGRRSRDERASRLREMFEHLGGTFIKIGQQISLRADLIPFEYCRELGRLLDSGQSMPFEEARRAIEETIKSPLREVFRSFDPEPIGKASIACVYQAILLSGERVAVKVRRPGIAQLFAADLKALEWLTRTLEWLTLMRPGLTSQLREDLREMLFEELDFTQEARYQELFKRNAAKAKMHYFSAPAIFPDLSGECVLVQEFVEGIWLSEIIYAVENDHLSTLAELAKRGTSPKVVARRLLLASYWSIHENMFFHADPHPANILVDDDGRLIFIDFGACGSTSQRSSRLQRHILHRFWRQDIEGAARAAVALIDPLPHIDTNELLKRASLVWWRKLYAMRSNHSPWWERTTASVWVSLLGVTREYHIAINLDTLRTMRASLLYDTLAVRIWKDADDLIFADYEKGAQRRVARQLFERAVTNSSGHSFFAGVSEMLDLLSRLQLRMNEIADKHPLRRVPMPSKSSFFVSEMFSFLSNACLVLSLFVVVLLLLGKAALSVESISEVFRNALREPIFIIALVAQTVLTGRRIQFRLKDKD